MKAVVFDETLSLQDLPKPQPGPGEALVKVCTAGICRTDVEISKGYMGFRGVAGHEFVGIVEESPDANLLGQRVVGEINAGCGRCSWCLGGMERHCPNRSVLGIKDRDGAFAEYLALPISNLIAVPDKLSNEEAIFTEPLAAALEILEQLKILPSHRVLILGDGKLGILISIVLRLTGCDVLLVGKHPLKMKLFEELGGSISTLENFTGRDDVFDVVVEASGRPSGWEMAVNHVKPRGVLVLKSTYHGTMDFNAARLVIDEITVVGSRCGPFAPALRLMDRGLIDPRPLITAIYALEQFEEAFSRSQEPGAMKVLLKISE